ncbi:hypothetical protein AB0G60_16975 [Streptomyces angustmyceticus]|uniref:Uncharacterized protein n=1 Tax=Streptomyces angustmyceticus TaxID=285578 RepID=A0A5J4LQ30_9ACTN|nr:hypothetical protein [Streptomyces angustmyceticus]UAL71014.1 hypothetical protein K7396_34440 [Streptomyces angustmyceticus]GES32548.1 hypothetical protein San01_50350 [Streptomyces angustmyceticus]
MPHHRGAPARPIDLAPAGTGFDDEVLAKLAEREKRSAQHEIDLRPQNTVEGYAADWKQWETFCALLGLPTTAAPGALTAFVEWLWVQPGWKAGTFTSPSTIDRRLSGVVVTGRTEYKITIDVRVSKASPRKVKVPFGSRPSTCPVRAWRAWTEAASLSDPDGYAFRALHPRWHTIMDAGPSPEAVGDVTTRLTARADLPVRHTGHSPLSCSKAGEIRDDASAGTGSPRSQSVENSVIADARACGVPNPVNMTRRQQPGVSRLRRSPDRRGRGSARLPVRASSRCCRLGSPLLRCRTIRLTSAALFEMHDE